MQSHRTGKSKGIVFYISPDGDDKNAGTKKQPFVTLERAKLAIKNNKGNPITVYLREGYYPLTESFVLGKKDVAENFPILISSFPGEKADIIGGKKIEA